LRNTGQIGHIAGSLQDEKLDWADRQSVNNSKSKKCQKGKFSIKGKLVKFRKKSEENFPIQINQIFPTFQQILFKIGFLKHWKKELPNLIEHKWKSMILIPQENWENCEGFSLIFSVNFKRKK
jgi:hypothetical protein